MVIDTKLGSITGVDMGNYFEYRSIPYAQPPVGELRWKAPVPVDPWKGVYDATNYKCRCMEPPRPERLPTDVYGDEFYDDPVYDRPFSEDSLYLSIWAPKDAENYKLPVAFWIHGGAFLGGHSSEKEFDGAAYCARGVILVSVDYRCNIFGFFAHPWLDAENDRHISGNYGILDQIAALRWVYDNIDAFGGDPHNITIFGQSAGAMSVQTLASSRLTGNMIAKAIMQSGGSYGSGLHRDIPLSEQEAYSQIFVETCGAKDLAALRAMSAEAIVTAMGPFMARMMPIARGIFLTPTMDGYVLDGGYYELMDEGHIKDIPYMLGTTKDDIMTTPDMVAQHEFSPLYEGSIAFSKKLESLGRKPAYVYYFTRDLPGNDFGAFHSCELWYMFGTQARCWRPWEAHDLELSRDMLDYWTNFMKTGDPNGGDLPRWEPCTAADAAPHEFR